MATPVKMPELGESITGGPTTRWLKEEGDQVEADEPLFEISTDKVDTEVPSPVAGVLKTIKVQADETVEVGAELAIIEQDGESGGEDESAESADDTADEAAEAGEGSEEAGSEEERESEAAQAEGEGKAEEQGEEPEAEEQPKPKAEASGDGGTTTVTMPELGEAITEGTIAGWLKEEGGEVEAAEPLFEISTDKVDTEVPSPVAGVLKTIKVQADETVEVGAELAIIEQDGESGGEDESAESADDTADEAAEAGEGSEEAGSEEERESEAAQAEGEGKAEEQGEEPEAEEQPKPKAEASGDGGTTTVTMPELGEAITEGTIAGWLKEEGDQVEADEPLFEISTDKVDTEVPSPVAGVLKTIKVQADETVEVGAELAIIEQDGESGGEDKSDESADDTADEAAEAGEGSEEAGSAEERESEAAQAEGEGKAEEQTEEQGEEPEAEEQPKPKAEASGDGGTTTVTMPELGESITEGTITRWLKEEGDQVEADEPLFEISTDKVDTEVPSPVAGVLKTIKVQADETVEVGA